MNKILIAACCAAALLAACGENDHAHEADGSHPAAEAAHDHGAGAEKLTHFTDRTELFVEFPPLVVGEPSASPPTSPICPTSRR